MKYCYIFLTVLLLTGCVDYYADTYRVYYHSGEATSGQPPSDSKKYANGDSVTLLGRGTLEKNDYIFLGWQYDSHYNYTDVILSPGNHITMQYTDINLFPIWDDGLDGPFEFKIENNEAEITGYTGSVGYGAWSVVIPETLQGKPVTRISNGVFNNLSISEVVLQKNLKHIGIGSFSDNDIAIIVIPPSVKTIGVNAFSNNSLRRITFSAGTNLQEISPYAFAFNELTTVIIPDGITTIGVGAFHKNALSQITIGANVTIEDDTAFGVDGASFRAFYSIEKKAGLYIYAEDDNWRYFLDTNIK